MKTQYKITYESARKVNLTLTSIQQTMNILKTLNDVSSRDFVGMNSTVEDLVVRLEEIAERISPMDEFDLRR